MTPRVLVVEDNEALADNIAELFTDAGAVVHICSTAEQSVQRAADHGFDLAIVDIRLPGEADGLELVPRLREHVPEGEVILVTGNASIDSAIAAVRHDAFAYVLKPFDPEHLLTLGQRALGQVSLRQERQRLARELAASEALYRSVVESVEAAIVGLDAEGHVRFGNRFLAQFSGYDLAQLEGHPLSALCVEDAGRDELALLVRNAERGTPARDRTFKMRGLDEAERLIRWTFTPLHTEDDTNASVLAVGLDVTERLELERRTAENEAMAAMGRLAAGITHEIRNPLNAAKLQLELLLRGTAKLEESDVSARLQQRAQLVSGELERLSQMLEEFLSLARPRAFTKEPFELGSLLEEVVALQSPQAEVAGVTLGAGRPSAPVRASGDRERIKQVLINLTGNAIEAMREQHEGHIELTATDTSEGWIEVRVADNGPGVPDAVAGQEFQPFVTTKEAGTGLGLAVVKRIIELHGGEVELSSTESQGTVARFTLPRA